MCGCALKRLMSGALVQIRPGSSLDEILNALLRAGELECGVADQGLATEPFARITDFLAEILLSSGAHSNIEQVQTSVESLVVPDELTISTPEGFAYYGLHPLAFADVLGSAPISSHKVVVIGIRSIGTTLSAVTRAAARKRGKQAIRMTVRPGGHPYNRVTQFTEQQLEAIQNALSEAAEFLVVDEGPGLSGSSFISVAEALVAAGVSAEKIRLLCGHEPDFESFCAADGPCRARAFRWIPVSGETRKPEAAAIFIGAGRWREHLLPDGAGWPGSWINFERAKYHSLHDDQEQNFFKFQGFGHYGDDVRQREKLAAEAGFGPEVVPLTDGFVSYPRLDGRPMSHRDSDANALTRLADYCAFREKTFGTELRPHVAALQHMTEHNLSVLRLDVPVNLRLERGVIADGRMQPHEWIVLRDGRMLKTDSGSHGDDHFFPGPTDIAWDLAGAIVEWRMNDGQREALLSRYEAQTGDRASRRIQDYIVAYCAFRYAYSLMAGNALQGNDESPRLQREAEVYRDMLVQRTVAAVL